MFLPEIVHHDERELTVMCFSTRFLIENTSHPPTLLSLDKSLDMFRCVLSAGGFRRSIRESPISHQSSYSGQALSRLPDGCPPALINASWRACAQLLTARHPCSILSNAATLSSPQWPHFSGIPTGPGLLQGWTEQRIKADVPWASKGSDSSSIGDEILRPPMCAQGPGQSTHPCWAINQPLVKEKKDRVGRGCLRRKKIGKRGENKRKGKRERSEGRRRNMRKLKEEEREETKDFPGDPVAKTPHS